MKSSPDKPTILQKFNRWMEPLYSVETSSTERLEDRITNIEKRLRSIEMEIMGSPNSPGLTDNISEQLKTNSTKEKR